MSITFNELLPFLQELTRADKLRLIQFLGAELGEEEIINLLVNKKEGKDVKAFPSKNSTMAGKASRQEKLRILLVDRNTLFRKGLASLLYARQDMTVVGEAENGLEAVKRAREVRPDLILMDVRLPEQGGIETLKALKEEMPDIQIVMLTVSEEDEDLFEAIKYGATGYLLKDLKPFELYEKLRGIRDGEAPISGVLATKILHEFGEPHDEDQADEAVDQLTPREKDVLEVIVTGATNKEIAERLTITENTVKIHMRNILSKLQVQNRVQAAVYAVREDLLEDDKTPE